MVIPFETLLKPIGGIQAFEEQYLGKDHFVIRFKDNPFADHFTWKDFSEYLNGWNPRRPRVNTVGPLQIVVPPLEDDTARARRWCNVKDRAQPKDVETLYKEWAVKNRTFVIPIHDRRRENLWNQCREFEKYFGRGQANIYASYDKGALCFPAHTDKTENFLFHVDGTVHWTMYKEFWGVPPKESMLTVDEEFELNAGDMLYIPRGKIHKTRPLTKRMLVSYHFNEPDDKDPRPAWRQW